MRKTARKPKKNVRQLSAKDLSKVVGGNNYYRYFFKRWPRPV